MPGEPAKTVHEIRLTELEPPEAPGKKLMDANLEMIRDVRVRLTVSVGRCELSVKELFELKESSLLTLDSGTRETVDVLLDGKVVARGDLVAVGDSFGVQITEVVKR